MQNNCYSKFKGSFVTYNYTVLKSADVFTNSFKNVDFFFILFVEQSILYIPNHLLYKKYYFFNNPHSLFCTIYKNINFSNVLINGTVLQFKIPLYEIYLDKSTKIKKYRIRIDLFFSISK